MSVDSRSYSCDYDICHPSWSFLLPIRQERIFYSGVIHTGISDHTLIFGIRKIVITQKNEENII